jgi:hypothetical protein
MISAIMWNVRNKSKGIFIIGALFMQKMNEIKMNGYLRQIFFINLQRILKSVTQCNQLIFFAPSN